MTLAEIEAALRKAARAAGYPWGLAEEAGKAARWLAAYGLPGAELTLALLAEVDGCRLDDLAPVDAQSPWRARGGALCPLAAGAALGDRAARLAGGATIELGECRYPLLLAAALGQAAWCVGGGFALRWPGVEIRCLADGMTIDAREPALLARCAPAVACRAVADADAPARMRPSHAAREVDQTVRAAIDRLARQTYVPASAASRAGAGSSLGDND